MPSGESCHDPAVRPAPAHAPAPRDAPHAPSHSPFQRIDLLHLNRDVLFAISNFCSVHDAVQFAMTCKDAYEIVMPRILADVTIGKADENQDEARDVPAPDDSSTRLEGPDRLEMFCNFMLADPKTRMRHLRALRLLDYAFARPSNTGFRDGWDADFSPADSLARLLHEATNLRILHIRDAEPLFQSHPSVYEALTELPALKELSLYYIGNFCLKTISQLRSRPAIIENGLWKDGPRPQGDVTPFGPYINSFQHIKLWECGCMLESVVDRFVWPNVHTLDIGGRIAKISELAHAFPNLRRLTFYLEFSVKQETGPAACWPELDYLETSAPIPSFPSPVRRLQLQYGIGAKYGSQHDLKTLPLMEKTNPVALSCTIAHTVPATMLERMRTSMPSLQYLELILNSGGRASMEWQAFQDWVERNLEIMRSTSIVGLCIAYSGAAGSSNPDDASVADANRRRLTHVARVLARAVPTLAYIAVGRHEHEKDVGMYDVDCLWFEVAAARTGEEPTLALLTAAEGERMRERLQDTPRV